MKLLVLASRFPYPLEKGDKLRMFHQIRELSQHHEIVLCSITDKKVQDVDYQEVKKYCSRIHIIHLSVWSIAQNIFKNILSRRKLPFQIAYFFDTSIQKKINAIIQTEEPEHIYCQLARMAEYALNSPIPKTLDYMDAFSKGAARRADSSGCLTQPFWRLEARRMAQYEAILEKTFDNLTVISEQDKNLFLFSEKSRITIVPNGVDTDYFCPHNYLHNQTDKPFQIAFVGNLGYYPNVEAAKYLVKQILPILKQSIPDIKILIAGARPTSEVLGLANDNVTVKGWLPDIREAYQQTEIFVAPLFHGSGLQNKILEAMAMGVPCVTTPLVNNAIMASPEKDILLAHTASEFVEKIQKLLTKSKKRSLYADNLSQSARFFVTQYYSWQKATFILHSLINETNHKSNY